MSKPYVYLERYRPLPLGSRGIGHRGGSPIERRIPTELGSHVRAAFHNIGDGSRSLEVYVQPNGYWSVETGPGPVTCGARRILVRGRLPGEWGPEEVSYPEPQRTATYASRQLHNVLADGPAPDEDFYRLQVSGESESHRVNISPAKLARIIEVLEEDE